MIVRLRKPGTKNEWLLIKHRDSFADAKWDAEQHAESVVSGRTLEDIAEGRPASHERRVVDASEMTWRCGSADAENARRRSRHAGGTEGKAILRSELDFRD